MNTIPQIGQRWLFRDDFKDVKYIIQIVEITYEPNCRVLAQVISVDSLRRIIAMSDPKKQKRIFAKIFRII
jgi:hypothetical protein